VFLIRGVIAKEDGGIIRFSFFNEYVVKVIVGYCHEHFVGVMFGFVNLFLNKNYNIRTY
jgi:hypothetical protein